MGPKRTFRASVCPQMSSEVRGRTLPRIGRVCVRYRYSAATGSGSASATMSNMIRFSSKSLGV